MTQTVVQALNMLWKGMAGIFVVIILIALLVSLLGYIDRKSSNE